MNMRVPSIFCMTCRGDWKRWRKVDVQQYREKNRQPLTEEQKNDKDLVSVIMPARESEKDHIQRTIDNIRENAFGPVEIITVLDGFNMKLNSTVILKFEDVIGQRRAVNAGAKMALGRYLFRLDPHCTMSPEWDARLKSSCGETDLVAPCFDHLDPESWEGQKRDVSFWRLDNNLKCRGVRPWKPLNKRKIEEEMMAISGGAWIIRKDYYWSLGGHDEWLGGHGAVGSEWSLKVWLTGGRCLLRTDVVCCHLFRAQLPYEIDEETRDGAFKKLHNQWVLGEDERIKKPMQWLLYKFNWCTKRPVSRYKNAVV